MPIRPTTIPSTVNEFAFDRGIRHATFLQRFTSGSVKRIDNLLTKQLVPDLQKQLEKRLKSIATRGYDTSVKTTQRLKAMMDSANGLIAGSINNVKTAHVAELNGLAIIEAKFQTSMLGSAIATANLPIGFDLITPAAPLLRSIVTQRPFQGEFLKDWYKQLTATTQSGLRKALNTGLAQGESIPALVKRIGPIIGTTRRQTAAIVRTATNHVVTQARELTYEANQDVVKGVRYVSTLDARTSDICISLDGQVFPVSQGPRPPMHHQCRSTTVPILKSWKELGIPLKEAPPSTRASMDGQVPANKLYPEWLKDQPVAIQNKVLGVGKAKLFRAGKFKITKFEVGQKQFLTLGQLQKELGQKVTAKTIAPVVPKPKPKPKPVSIPKPKDDLVNLGVIPKDPNLPGAKASQVARKSESLTKPKPKPKRFEKFGANPTRTQLTQETNAWQQALAGDERSIVESWTGILSGTIRKFQATGQRTISYATKELTEMVTTLDRALSKGPRYRGKEVWRGISSKTPLEADLLSKPGSTQKWTQFSSTSKDIETGQLFGRKATEFETEFVEFRIRNNKTGVDVEDISSMRKEREILKPTNTEYRVISRKRASGKTFADHTVHGWVVELEEITPGA